MGSIKFEKTSGVDRIHGVSSEKEAELLGALAERLKNQKFSEYEREKTPLERAIVQCAISNLPEFLHEYGGTPLPFSEDNVHVANPLKLSPEDRVIVERNAEGGWYLPDRQAAVVEPHEAILKTAERIIHELLHLHASTELIAEESLSLDSPPPFAVNGEGMFVRNIGLGVMSRDQSERHFKDMDEAVIQSLTMRFCEKYLGTVPGLKAEIEARDSMRGIGEGGEEIAAVLRHELPNWGMETAIYGYEYPDQRRILNRLMLRSATAERTAEDAFRILARSCLSGKRAELLAVVKEIYGPRSLHKLKEDTKVEPVADESPETGPEHILSREEVLSELRRRCEISKVERELGDADGIYLLEVINADNTQRYTYQRKGSFEGGIASASTTIRSEDLDDGFSRTLADYDPKTRQWVNQ